MKLALDPASEFVIPRDVGGSTQLPSVVSAENKGGRESRITRLSSTHYDRQVTANPDGRRSELAEPAGIFCERENPPAVRSGAAGRAPQREFDQLTPDSGGIGGKVA